MGNWPNAIIFLIQIQKLLRAMSTMFYSKGLISDMAREEATISGEFGYVF
jgi:hypothetical protein